MKFQADRAITLELSPRNENDQAYHTSIHPPTMGQFKNIPHFTSIAVKLVELLRGNDVFRQTDGRTDGQHHNLMCPIGV